MKVELPRHVFNRLVRRLHRGLVEFGYPDVTVEETERATTKALAGLEPSGKPARLVIEMLVRQWLEEAKVIEPISSGKARS